MAPELNRKGLAPTGAITQRATAGEGDIVVTCPRPGCSWQTVRPNRPRYAASALLAHSHWEHAGQPPPDTEETQP